MMHTLIDPYGDGGHGDAVGDKKFGTLLDLCVSSLRRGHANLLCIVPILTDDPRRESSVMMDTLYPASQSRSLFFGCWLWQHVFKTWLGRARRREPRVPSPSSSQGISGLVAEYIVAIDVTRVRFPADALLWQRQASAIFSSGAMLADRCGIGPHWFSLLKQMRTQRMQGVVTSAMH